MIGAPHQQPAARLWAGAARVEITPPADSPLIGFASRGAATGTHDPLTATLLALGDEDETGCVIASLDLLWLDDEFCRMVRRAIASEVGLSEDHVLLAATHTHYGPPTGAGDFPCPGEETLNRYHGVLIERLVVAAQRAIDTRRPVTAVTATTRSAVGINRRQTIDGAVTMGADPDGPVDTWVGVLQLLAAGGRNAGTTVGTLVNCACHPVCHGGRYDRLSADYPARVREVVESTFGGVCVVLQGACGDVNPCEMGVAGAAHRTGSAIGAAVLAAVAAGTPIALEPPAVLRAEHRAQPWVPDTVATAEQELAALDQRARVDRDLNSLIWIGHRRDRLRRGIAVLEGKLKPVVRPARLAVVTLGSQLAIATSPGEVFSELGQQVRAGSPFPITFFVGYTDGMLHYLPTAAEFSRGGYEVEHGCVVAAGEPEQLRDVSLALLALAYEQAYPSKQSPRQSR